LARTAQVYYSVLASFLVGFVTSSAIDYWRMKAMFKDIRAEVKQVRVEFDECIVLRRAWEREMVQVVKQEVARVDKLAAAAGKG
jgi:hypothetical protein